MTSSKPIIVGKDYFFMIHYNDPNIPVLLEESSSAQPDYFQATHWHGEFEFLRVKSGSFTVTVNEITIELKTGDTIFINTEELHSYKPSGDDECMLQRVLASPDLLTQKDSILKDILNDFFQDKSKAFVLFRAEDPASEVVSEHINALTEKANQVKSHLLEIIGHLFILMDILCYIDCKNAFRDDAIGSEEFKIQKRMISYISKHYQEKITLDDIAASGKVHKNKCCRMFDKYSHLSPINYVNYYRLERSCILLRNTEKSIAKIAKECGFTQQSYYNRLFLRQYNCTPREYRLGRNNISE